MWNAVRLQMGVKTFQRPQVSRGSSLQAGWKRKRQSDLQHATGEQQPDGKNQANVFEACTILHSQVTQLYVAKYTLLTFSVSFIFSNHKITLPIIIASEMERRILRASMWRQNWKGSCTRRVGHVEVRLGYRQTEVADLNCQPGLYRLMKDWM